MAATDQRAEQCRAVSTSHGLGKLRTQQDCFSVLWRPRTEGGQLWTQDSIYCRLSYGRGSRSVTPLVEATSTDFLCPYRTHCFALCHCCDFDACDCEMICPTNCSCYHDQSWSTNVVDCSAGGGASSGTELLTDIPVRIPMDATDVYLDGNNLGQLLNHAFIGKKNLRTLLLNSSSIATLQNYTFSGVSHKPTSFKSESAFLLTCIH